MKTNSDCCHQKRHVSQGMSDVVHSCHSPIIHDYSSFWCFFNRSDVCDVSWRQHAALPGNADAVGHPDLHHLHGSAPGRSQPAASGGQYCRCEYHHATAYHICHFWQASNSVTFLIFLVLVHQQLGYLWRSACTVWLPAAKPWIEGECRSVGLVCCYCLNSRADCKVYVQVSKNLGIVGSCCQRFQHPVGVRNSVLPYDWRQGSRLQYKQVVVVGLTVEQLLLHKWQLLLCLFVWAGPHICRHS